MQVNPDWEANSTTPFVQSSVPQTNVAAAAQTIVQVYTITLNSSAASGPVVARRFGIAGSFLADLLSGTTFANTLMTSTTPSGKLQ
jgi:hypothetical protein